MVTPDIAEVGSGAGRADCRQGSGMAIGSDFNSVTLDRFSTNACLLQYQIDGKQGVMRQTEFV